MRVWAPRKEEMSQESPVPAKLSVTRSWMPKDGILCGTCTAVGILLTSRIYHHTTGRDIIMSGQHDFTHGSIYFSLYVIT